MKHEIIEKNIGLLAVLTAVAISFGGLVEIIPLIDIMFFLLASFMMVSLNLDKTQNIKVNLPPATDRKPTP